MPRITEEAYNRQQVALQPLAAPRVDTRPQTNAFIEFGGALRDIAKNAAYVGSKLQEQEDAFAKAEGTRIAAITTEQFKSILQKNAQEITDPDEFETKTKDDLRGAYSAATQSKNGAVVDYARQHLEPKQIETDRLVSAFKFGKQKDQARRGVEDSLMSYSRLAIDADTDEERNDSRKAYGDMVGHLESRGFLSTEQGGEYLRNFGETIRTGRVARFGVRLRGELDNLVNGATTGQPADELFNQGTAKIDAFTDMPVAQREDLKSKFKDSLWTGAIEGRIEKDPFKAEKELSSGKYNDLIDQQSLLLLKNKSEMAIDRIALQQEAFRKESVRQIGKQVTDFKDAKMLGFDWAGNESRLAEAVRGTEHQAEFENVRQASRVLGQFNKLAPVEQEVYLRSLVNQPMSGDGAKFASTLAAVHEKTKAGLKEDPITFAMKQRSVPSGPALDLNSPGSLQARSVIAGMVENRYSLQNTISPLSGNESDQLRATLEKAPADQQVQIFRKLKQGLEDRQIKAVAGQLARKADPVLVQAMGLSVEAPEAASRILKGREIMRDNKEIMPKGADLKTAQDLMASTLGEAYKGNPAHYSAVADSAMSIYAFKSWQQRDLSGTIDTKRLEESMKEASGGVLQLGSFGGRYTVQAPRYGATEADFMDSLKRADYSKAKGMKAADIQRHGIFESIGDGRYLVKIGPGYVQSDKGPFVLDLNLPVRGAGGASVGGAAGLVR